MNPLFSKFQRRSKPREERLKKKEQEFAEKGGTFGTYPPPPPHTHTHTHIAKYLFKLNFEMDDKNIPEGC